MAAAAAAAVRLRGKEARRREKKLG